MTKYEVGITDWNGSEVPLNLNLGFNDNLLILGTTGSGKTRLVKKILHKISQDAALFVIQSDSGYDDIGDTTDLVSINLTDTVLEFPDRVLLNDLFAVNAQQYIDAVAKVVERVKSLPIEQEKFIVLDGFFKFAEHGALEDLLKLGRKINVKVILTLQNLDEIAGDKLDLLSFFGTRIILYVTEESRDKIIKAKIADGDDFTEKTGCGTHISPSGNKTKVTL